MLRKALLVTTATCSMVLMSATALADIPPMPECVDNPACKNDDGCSVSGVPAEAPVAVGVIAAVGAAALFARRRSR